MADPVVKPVIAAPRLGVRPESLWTDSGAWIAAHTGRIVVGLVIAGIVAALLLGAKWLGALLARRNAEHHHWRRIVGTALSKTRLWFIVAVALQLLATFAHAPPDLAKIVYFLFVIAATLQAAVYTREIVLGLVEYRATEHEGLGNAIGLVRLLVTIALFALASVLILSNLGVNVTGLIAGLGVGGIAIGLAAQGIFADLFAALAILFDRPFRRGDIVKWDTTIGTVEAIGLKSTRIRATTGEQVIVANKNLLDKEIRNLARLERRRVVQTIGLIYETPPDVLARLPDMMREIVESCRDCTLLRFGLNEFGTSSLDFELQYDVHTESLAEVALARHNVGVAIIRRFNAEGIAFAYPVQVAYTGGRDGKPVFPPAPSEADIVEAE